MTKMLKTSAKGRKCMFPHCNRTLSIYNHEDYCHVHLDQMIERRLHPSAEELKKVILLR